MQGNPDYFHRNKGNRVSMTPQLKEFFDNNYFMTYEKDFYSFVVQRMNLQLSAINKQK